MVLRFMRDRLEGPLTDEKAEQLKSVGYKAENEKAPAKKAASSKSSK